jgi:hypothetical protein
VDGGHRETRRKGKHALTSSGTGRSAKADFLTRLDELAYATAQTTRRQELRKQARAEERKRLLREREVYLNGGVPKSKSLYRSENAGAPVGDLSAFSDRMDQLRRLKIDRRNDAIRQLDYDAVPDKKFCPECGAQQSFGEWKDNMRRCKKDECHGAFFQPKKVWTQVEESFMGRLAAANERTHKNRTALLRQSQPAFRLETKTVFDPKTRTTKEEKVVPRPWAQVRDDFYERQNSVLEKREELQEAAREERAREEEAIRELQNQVQVAKHYKFRAPLPSFFERQQAHMDRRTARSWEEMHAEWEEKYGRRDEAVPGRPKSARAKPAETKESP